MPGRSSTSTRSSELQSNPGRSVPRARLAASSRSCRFQPRSSALACSSARSAAATSAAKSCRANRRRAVMRPSTKKTTASTPTTIKTIASTDMAPSLGGPLKRDQSQPAPHNQVARSAGRQRAPRPGSGGRVAAAAPRRHKRPNKNGPPQGAARKLIGGDLLSQALAGQVPSALRGLTTLFGMGRGVSPSPKPPEKARDQPPRSFKTAQRHTRASKNPSSPRTISTGLLRTLPFFQIRPINLVVYQGSYSL